MEIPYMRGILGQYVFAIPELNAVVVRLGHKRSDTRSAQHYPDDIDTWLGAAVEMIQESTENQRKGKRSLTRRRLLTILRRMYVTKLRLRSR